MQGIPETVKQHIKRCGTGVKKKLYLNQET